ncbi:MAG: hypothetical protein AABZ27_01405 [Candidatus Omnitrophota bacterium]
MTRLERYSSGKIQLIATLLFLFFSSPAFCAHLLKEEAVEFHRQGHSAQESGMLNDALGFYQKAAAIDPASAHLYNDLGSVYEMMGEFEIASGCLLKAVSIEPESIEAYSRLALLSEKDGNFPQASKYWLKFIELGNKNNPAVREAKNRVYEIGRVIPEVMDSYIEVEASSLKKEISSFKRATISDKESRLQRHLSEGNAFCQDKDYLNALKMYMEAKESDPQDNQVNSLLDAALSKLLL